MTPKEKSNEGANEGANLTGLNKLIEIVKNKTK